MTLYACHEYNCVVSTAVHEALLGSSHDKHEVLNGRYDFRGDLAAQRYTMTSTIHQPEGRAKPNTSHFLDNLHWIILR